MAKAPAFKIHTIQLNIGRYLGVTASMDATEAGAYTALLVAAFQAWPDALPASETRLARMARCTPKVWGRIRETILEQLVKTPRGFHIDYVQEEAQKYLSKSAINRDNRLKGLNSGQTAVKRRINGGLTTHDTRPFNPLTPFDVEKSLGDYELREMLSICPTADRKDMMRRYNEGVKAGELQFPIKPAQHFMAWLKTQPEAQRH